MAELRELEPIPLVKEDSPIDMVAANVEAGEAIPFSDPSDAGHVREVLQSRANASLPKGTRFEIRTKISGDFERDRALAWYRHPRMDDESFASQMIAGGVA